MLEQRRQLIAERRRAAAETKRQKEAITKVMDEVRSNATMASHFVSDALAGRLSITNIARGDMSVFRNHTSPGKKSSLSTTHPGNRSGFQKTSSAEQLGLQGRQSKSEGFEVGKKGSSGSGSGWNDDAMLDAALNGDSKKNFNKSFLTQDADPMPYVSPYDSMVTSSAGKQNR
jgi:hypothetical protein